MATFEKGKVFEPKALVIPAGARTAVKAEKPFKMIITMIKGKEK